MDSTAQQTVLLGELLEGFTSALTPEATEKLAKLKADPAMQAKMDELAAKCNEGQLTDAERTDYEAYVRVGNFFNVLKAKAKIALKNSP